MARPHLSIRAKLILSISLPLLLTYLGLLAWDYQHQRDLAISELKEFLQQRAEGIAGQLDARLTGITQLSRLVATPLEIRHADAQIRTAALGALRNPWVSAVTIVFDDGDGPVTKTVTNAGDPFNFRTLDLTVAQGEAPPWFDRVRKQAATGWTSGRTVDSTGGEAHRVATYYAPVRSGETVIGAVGLDVSIDALRRMGPPRIPSTQRAGIAGPPDTLPSIDLGPAERPAGERNDRGERGTRGNRADRIDRIDRGPNGGPNGGLGGGGGGGFGRFEDYLLFDATGALLGAPAGDENIPGAESIYDDAKLIDQPVLADVANIALGGESQVIQVDNLNKAVPTLGTDTRHWLALSQVRASGWLVATALPESGRVAEIMNRLWQRAIFLSIGSLVMLAVVWAVAVRISRPIEALAQGVDAVAGGDLSTTVPDGGSKDELGRLARGFNHMTARIRQHVAEIRNTAAEHERVESELRVARQIQLDLLPKTFPPFPDRTEFALHALNLSALHVAGDFYDFFFVPGGKLMLVIADVSGKGVPAALLMAVTRTLVRNLAMTGQSPAQVMTATNRALLADTPNTLFVTMILCQYDPATGILTYVNAGHPAALRLRHRETPQPFCDDYSSILGVDDSGAMGDFVQHDIQLAPGDTVLLYTDGASEAPLANDKILGTTGLSKLLERHSADSPEALCNALAEQLRSLHGSSLHDDITLLALRRSPTR